MLVPSSSPRKRGILDVMNGSGMILQNPGLPPAVWTPEARVRMWVYSSGSCAMLGSVAAVATWYLAGLHIEGMGGIVAYLAFLMWAGAAVFGILGSIVAACMTEDQEQTVSILILAVNGVLLLLAGLFLSSR
jgi:uncharacterized membrane protein YfcA